VETPLDRNLRRLTGDQPAQLLALRILAINLRIVAA
jgi:hypothetical protein